MKVSTILIMAVLFLVGVKAASATPQLPDLLIYEGKKYPIYGEPLEPYFKKNPDRRPKFCGGFSGLWRGYIAEIEVIEKELFLKDIKIHTVNPLDPNCLQKSKLSEVVPSGKKFKLNWFSGVLMSAHGEHIGGDNFYEVWKVYEKYTLFTVGEGNLENVRHFTNAEYQKYLEKP